MAEYVIGVDLGGTQIRSVLADESGTILARDQRLTEAHEGPDAVIERIVASIHAVRGVSPVAAIGIGAPGPTDPHRGVVLTGANLPGWKNVDLRSALYKSFGIPIYVGNDANVAGLAEYQFGAGRGVKHMIYITQSTGIGGGIVVSGKLLVGAQGLAAEIGHVTIDLSKDNRETGVVGTLEGMAAGPDIAARAQRRLRAGAESRALALAGGAVEAVTTKELCQAAEQEDAFAVEQFRETGVYLGVGIANLLHIFNPQRIVIGGGVWLHCHRFMEPVVWETIKARTQSPEYWQWLEIVSAELGSDVGLLGAVALALTEVGGRKAG